MLELLPLFSPPGIKFDNSTGALLSSQDRYRRLVGHLFYLVFHDRTSPLLFSSLVSFFSILGCLIGMLLYICSVISRVLLVFGLFFLAKSSLQLCAYFDFRQGVLSRLTPFAHWLVSSWVVLLFHGKPRSRPPSLFPPPRPNIAAWPPLFANSCGSAISFKSSRFLLRFRFPFGAIIKLLSTLLKTQSFMSRPRIYCSTTCLQQQST
ncbi:UNVERIFIED_CONTAM: hypothetical protein Slati_3135100 [Sesamum latifolium]|uniref:Uncharacterized protein n=1 Tax=Sesamum latifolium TaxID=2727402 RepID=A0AAW2UVT5_9LAMI